MTGTLPATRRVDGTEVRIGDVLLHLGKPRMITELEPYTGPLLDVLGAGTRIARSQDWVILLAPGQACEVLRP